MEMRDDTTIMALSRNNNKGRRWGITGRRWYGYGDCS
jgi:hypothetical protein